jgi:hypothetical protein
MYSSLKKRALIPVIGVAAVGGMLFAAQTAAANIVRPAGATPIAASVVIAYKPCNAADPAGSTHNPANLPGDACLSGSPSFGQFTPRLTAGDPIVNNNPLGFRGNVRLSVTQGPTDVQFPSGAPSGNYVNDVRCTPAYNTGNPAVCGAAPGSGNLAIGGGASANPDYSGDLNVIAYIRITDQANSGPVGGPYTSDATIKDLAFAVAADCATTPATNIGGTCLPRHASANALCACVASGKRSNIEVGVGTPSATLPAAGGIFSMDGGNDGVVTDLVPDTDSPAPFTRQGLFLP